MVHVLDSVVHLVPVLAVARVVRADAVDGRAVASSAVHEVGLVPAVDPREPAGRLRV